MGIAGNQSRVLGGGRVRTGGDVGSVVAGSVASVLDYANEHPEQVQALLAAEQAGKNRVTLVEALTNLNEQQTG